MTSQNQTDTGISSHAFFLADYAAVEGGKIYVSGGFWDRLSVPEFPASAFFSVVAMVHVPWSAYHALHKFSISVEDADANELAAGFDGEFQVSAAEHMRVGDPTAMPLAAVLNGMEFGGPGDFAFILRVDGVEIDRWPLRVVQADPTAAASPASGPSVG